MGLSSHDSIDKIILTWSPSFIHSVHFQCFLSSRSQAGVFLIILVLAGRLHLWAPELHFMDEASWQKVACSFIGQDLLKQPSFDNSIEKSLLGLFSVQLQWNHHSKCRVGRWRRDKREAGTWRAGNDWRVNSIYKIKINKWKSVVRKDSQLQMSVVKSNSVICLSSVSEVSHCVSLQGCLLPRGNPVCVRFCPFATSVTFSLMVFVFTTSFQLPSLPCS